MIGLKPEIKYCDSCKSRATLCIDRLRSSATATCKNTHASQHQAKGSYRTIKESYILRRVYINRTLSTVICVFRLWIFTRRFNLYIVTSFIVFKFMV